MKNLFKGVQILEERGRQDFQYMDKQEITKFMSMLSEVNIEDAIKIVEQFPDFAKNSIVMIDNLIDLCNKALDDDKALTILSIEAYMQILNELKIILEKEDIDEYEKKYIVEKMIEVADKIALKDTEGKEYKKDVLKTIGGVMAATIAIGIIIIGKKKF